MIHQPLEPNTDRETMLQGRRRLLQAAAATATAPLIATLPNGAAAATASTAQCIVTSRGSSPPNVISNATPPSDTFVRQHGTMAVFRLDAPPATTETVYSIAPVSGTYYNSDGTEFDTDGYTKDSEDDVLLLRVFKPISDTGDPVNNPTSMDNCGSTPIPRCIFPVTQLNPSPDNMGIAASCLCSVNPSLLGSGICDALRP
jgi:hypothetical protein